MLQLVAATGEWWRPQEALVGVTDPYTNGFATPC